MADKPVELIAQAREQDLERRFGSWQDLDLNADGTESDPIENIVTDAFALIARLADALEQDQTDLESSERHVTALENHRDGLILRAEAAEAETATWKERAAAEARHVLDVGEKFHAAEARAERAALLKAAAYIRELEQERTGARRAVVRAEARVRAIEDSNRFLLAQASEEITASRSAEARAERLAAWAVVRGHALQSCFDTRCNCGLSAALGLVAGEEGSER